MNVKSACSQACSQTKREITLADETSHIDFVLWRQRAEKANFKVWDTLSLQGLFVTSSFEIALNIVEKEITAKVEAQILNRAVQMIL